MYKPHGIFTAMVSCFAEDGAPDLAAMRASVRHQLASGVHGLCPLGGTGEPLSQTLDERKRLIDAVAEENAGRAQLLVGCCTASQDDIVATGRHAKAAGADAIMVIAPYFTQPKPRHILHHFSDIAEKTDMPLVVFNGPGRAGLKLETAFLLELVETIPTLVGIKEACGDIVLASELVRQAPPRFAILQGYDEMILPTLAVGGVGAVVSLGCLVPELLVGLWDAWHAGDRVHALALQQALLPIGSAVYREPNPSPLKRALAMVGRPAGPTRPPLYPPSPETEVLLRAMLADLPAADAEAQRAYG